MNIYIHREGAAHGPYSIEYIKDCLKQGHLTPTDLVFLEGDSTWSSIDQIPWLSMKPVAPMPLSRTSHQTPGKQPEVKIKTTWRLSFVIFLPTLLSAFAVWLILPWLFESYVTWTVLVFCLFSNLTRYFSTQFIVTPDKVLIQQGILSLRTNEFFIKKIESVEVFMGIFGVILNYGTVIIVGTGASRQTFKCISSPLTFRAAIQAKQ
jgi:membrane protein YdbS with pleckstrin-like domain